MPDESSFVLVVVPVHLFYPLADFRRGEILVATKHLQGFVLVIGYGVVADHLVSHRDGKEVRSYLFPVELLLVVEVRPVEIETRAEVLLRARIGKVQSLLRCHGHKNLNERVNPP